MAAEKTAWLDKSYVEKILQDTEKDKSIAVSGIIKEAGSAQGDNYGSDMYRVIVEFSRTQDGRVIQEKKSLIVKVTPQSGLGAQLMSDLGAFEIEMLIMMNTLPRMNMMLTELGMRPLSARCLFVQREKPVHLVIEDLVSRGFRLADRRTGLDLDHCLLAMRNLGRFHASSLALKEKDPECLANYTKGLFHEDRPPTLRVFIKEGLKALGNETRNWPEISPEISEKLLKLSEVAWEKACEAARYREDEFNVLAHGDFWVSNMMFSYDEQQKPIDNIFVDFQISHYGSPAVDILPFLGSSISEDVRLNHREKILREYHNSLTSTIAKLKCNTEAPSFDDLQEILKKRALIEVLMYCAGLPITLLDKDEVTNLDELMSESNTDTCRPGYRGIAYRKIMTRLLPVFDSMGLLD